MTVGKTKCSVALKALVRPITKHLNWKVWVLMLFLGTGTCLSSCTAFEETYYDQADDDLPPGCKLIDSVIVCE